MTTKRRENGRIDDSRRSSQTFRGERVQMRLLQMEEKHRSYMLYDQIKSFEDKVYLSYDQFNVDFLHHMFQELTKRTVVDVRKVKTIAHLRKCLLDLKNIVRCKLRHRHVKTTPEEEKIIKYFTWFFQFFNYLRELRDNFRDRIYDPLFRYFFNTGYGKSDQSDKELLSPAPSAMSFRSMDSGYSGLSGLTAVLVGDDRDVTSRARRASYDETQEARRRLATKNALLALGKEFADIKTLYDTTEMEKLAERMTHLKERMDYLLDREKTLNLEYFAQDSEKTIFHLKIQELGNANIVRLIPDILIKFQKAAWIARRWLESDDRKTKDLNTRLQKLTKLEMEMNRRLTVLSKEIQQQEVDLDEKSELLGKLLEREERSNNLSQYVFDLKNKKDALAEQMRKLNDERGDLCQRLTKASKEEDIQTYKSLRPLYERNKLQRFALERQLATLNYHMSIAEADMNVELQVKASLIRSTNDIQDKCELLEQKIERAKREQKVIQTALIPITKDKETVTEKIQQREEDLLRTDSEPSYKAQFVGSRETDDYIADLNAEFMKHSTHKKGSFFLTQLPEDEHRISNSIETLDSSLQNGNITYVPELVASEW